MNHSLKVGPAIDVSRMVDVDVPPCDRSARLGKALSEDESSIAALENKWTTLLIDEARSWPGEKRPGWIPMAAVFMVLEQVYKDGITVGARSWQDEDDDNLLEHFSYGGTK